MTQTVEVVQNKPLEKVASAGAAPLTLPPSTLKNLVHCGVGIFGERYLTKPTPLFTQLQTNYALSSQGGIDSRGWNECVEYIYSNLEKMSLPEPLALLVQDFQINLPELFLLTLCGEIEDSHLLNMALAELQAPDSSSRPRMHLVCHLLQELFAVSTSPMSLGEHKLVRAGILNVVGDEPLPLRSLSVAPNIWPLINKHLLTWPGTSRLPKCDVSLIPDALRESLPQLLELLRSGGASGLVLRGPSAGARIVADELARQLDLSSILINAEQWQSDTLLPLASRYAHWLPVVEVQLGPADRFVGAPRQHTPLIVISGREGVVELEGMLEVDVPMTTVAQRRTLWQQSLSACGADAGPLAQRLAQSALIDGATIKQLANSAKLEAQRQLKPLDVRHIAEVRKRHGGNQLRQLAQPVNRCVERGALVLPDPIEQQFDRLVQRCIQRESLWHGLGASAVASENYGVRALFSGDSGTGKTLAASHLATLLGAPMYRLDMASVMNKYIGETEKNLGLLLDEAAASDTILLLDEADALFGKRTEGDSAGDRFSNMLTNFLLTRIESHHGIVILTSNNRARIDTAFTRRLDAVIEFPMPTARERLLIWKSHLGGRAAGDDFCQLLASYCELPGGHIRNAVLNAAAIENNDCSAPISKTVLLCAIAEEYRKLGRAVPPALAEFGDEQTRGVEK